MVGAVIVKLNAYVPKFAEEKDHGDCAGQTKEGTDSGPKDAEEPKKGLEDVVNGNVHIVRFLFGIMCIVPSYARNVSSFQRLKFCRAHHATLIT